MAVVHMGTVSNKPHRLTELFIGSIHPGGIPNWRLCAGLGRSFGWSAKQNIGYQHTGAHHLTAITGEKGVNVTVAAVVSDRANDFKHGRSFGGQHKLTVTEVETSEQVPLTMSNGGKKSPAVTTDVQRISRVVRRLYGRSRRLIP